MGHTLAWTISDQADQSQRPLSASLWPAVAGLGISTRGCGVAPVCNYESHLSALSFSPRFQTTSDVPWCKEVDLCLCAVCAQSIRQPARILKARILTCRSWTNVFIFILLAVSKVRKKWDSHPPDLGLTSPSYQADRQTVFMDNSFELTSYFVFCMTRKWQKIPDVSVIFSFPALCSQKAWMHVDDPCVLPGVQTSVGRGRLDDKEDVARAVSFFFFFFCTLKEQTYF